MVGGIDGYVVSISVTFRQYPESKEDALPIMEILYVYQTWEHCSLCSQQTEKQHLGWSYHDEYEV